jgi:CHAT domain-containing protein
MAYALRREGEVKLRDLGPAHEINNVVGRFRKAVRDPRRKDVPQLARTLDEKVMRPVRALIGDAKHLLISPDGELNLVPFEAFVDEKGKYLIESYSVSYLTTGRDLIRMQVARASKSAPTVVADPVFGDQAPDSLLASAAPVKSISMPKRRSITNTRNITETYFAPLGGTAKEANSIKALFPDVRVFTGPSATETAVKELAAPKILHIATHGFFLVDQPSDESGNSSMSQRRAAAAKIENPLLRSGLALAGANRHSTGVDDGILTALEASGLNLWGTKLVVLSACDTGVGEIRNGEGVYGLRRSFVLAGTESLVMSLWPVSDYVTRELMTGYYKNLKNGSGRGGSLRNVQLSMIKSPTRRHPFYWASFIQSGEWANLDGKRP